MPIVNNISAFWRQSFWDLINRVFLALFAQRDRWGLWLPVPLAFGICAYFGRVDEPSGPWGAVAVLGIALLALWIKRGRWVMLAWLCLAAVALGFLASYLRTHSLDTVMLSRESGPVVIAGRVQEVDALPKALRITLTDLRLVEGWLKRGDALPQTVRVKLKNKDAAQPVAGDIVQVRAVLLPLSGPVAPGAFDFQRHAYFQGLGATGYAIGDLTVVTPVAQSDDLFEYLRHAIRKKIAAGVTDQDVAAIVTAFLIGESKGISDAAWEDIRRSGIAHLLAISGFHITVVTGAFFFLVRALLALWPWAALHWPIKKISAVAAMAGSVFYLELIGAPVTAERAVIMACVVMIAIIIERDPFSLRLAAFAAGFLLLLQPEALIGPSFQMSFAAVVALIAFYETMARRWIVADQHAGILRRCGVYLVACLLTTVIATIATAPFTLYHFGQVPLLAGLVSNMIAVPLSSIITLPFGILACLLMPFGLEGVALWVVEQSMVLIMLVVDETSSWRHAVVMLDSFPAGWLVLFTLGGLWVCIWRDWWRWLGLAPIAVVVIGVLFFSPRASVLVADNGRQTALRDDEGRLWLAYPKRERFISNAWLEREAAAHQQQAAGSWADAEAAGVLRCDAKACIFNSHGVMISLVKSPEAVVEDCDQVDLFIAAQARLPSALCPGKRRWLIDQNDLRYSGAHTVYTVDGHLHVRNVAKERGERPWTPLRLRAAQSKI